jgi:hypothetical protein
MRIRCGERGLSGKKYRNGDVTIWPLSAHRLCLFSCTKTNQTSSEQDPLSSKLQADRSGTFRTRLEQNRVEVSNASFPVRPTCSWTTSQGFTKKPSSSSSPCPERADGRSKVFRSKQNTSSSLPKQVLNVRNLAVALTCLLVPDLRIKVKVFGDLRDLKQMRF